MSYLYSAKMEKTTYCDGVVLYDENIYDITTNDFENFHVVLNSSNTKDSPASVPVAHNLTKEMMCTFISSGNMCIRSACSNIRLSEAEAIAKLHEEMKESLRNFYAYGELAEQYGIVQRVSDGEETIEGLDKAQGVLTDGIVEFTYGENLVDDYYMPFEYRIAVNVEDEIYVCSVIKAQRDYGDCYVDVIAADFTETQFEKLCDRALVLYNEKLEEVKSVGQRAQGRENNERSD